MSPVRKKKARVPPNLTAERIRDEALRLIEAEGLEGFSTRKLGRALGVEGMAIYWHYESKDALLDDVVELLVEKISAPFSDAQSQEQPADFIDALRALAHSYRNLAHQYPRAFPLLATRRFATNATQQFLANLFVLAEDYGLDARKTACFYRLVSAYCSGIALDELAGIREAELYEDLDRLEGLAGSARFASVQRWLRPQHYDEVFSFGLEVLLDALLRERSAAPRKGADMRKLAEAPSKRRTSQAPRRTRPRSAPR